MLNLTDINSFPTQDGGALSLLRDIAQKYCPEDARELRQSVFPDETHVWAVTMTFKAPPRLSLRITGSV